MEEKLCFKNDCRYFKGEKPCKFGQRWPCKHYLPDFKRILIIKLDSLGDILRTTPLLRKINQEFPHSEVFWLTSERGTELLKYTPGIDHLISINSPSTFLLLAEEFDYLFSLDKQYEAIAFAKLVNARKKMGFTLNSHGRLSIFNYESEYAYRLGIDDNLKFQKNQLSYQEITFKMLGLEWNKEEYVFEVNPEDIEYWRGEYKDAKRLIGIHPGFGEKFPTKYWPKKHWEKLIQLLKDNNFDCILIGGKGERQLLVDLTESTQVPVHIFDNYSDFASFISILSLVVALDSFPLHMAIARKVPTVALFGPTAPQEIYSYDRVHKIFKKVECSPCYKMKCHKNHECLNNIIPEEVFGVIKSCVN